MSNASLQERRERLLGPGNPLFYDDPVHLVRGEGVWVYDADNPTTRVVNIRGHVTEITEDGADAHIDKLARKYTGADGYGNHIPEQTRVIVRISPDNITGH